MEVLIRFLIKRENGMPIIKKKQVEKYKTFFRISSLWEVIEEGTTVLNVTAEILPRYSSGLPEESDPKLSDNLQNIYENYKHYIVNKTGQIIRKLAVEVMVLSEKPERSEKLKKLKMVLLESNTEYATDHYMLELTFKFKPLMKPVFQSDFYHSGIIYQEELKKQNALGYTVFKVL